jgi:hypothetical protein
MILAAVGSLLHTETRRSLAVIVAFFALLMPALLPFGSRPVAAIGSYIAPHAHHDTAAATPHDHSGDREALPDAAQLLAPAVPALLVAVIAFLSARPVVPTAAPATVAAPSRPRFFSGRPRAPPADA